MSKSKPSWEKLMKTGEKALLKQDFPHALALFEQALALSPDNAELYKWIGRVHGDQGDDEAAEKAYLTAIEKDPSYWASYNNLGLLYKSRQRLDEALELLLKAASFNPDTFIPYGNLSQLYENRGELDQAIHYIQLAKEKKTDDWLLYYHHGYFCHLNNQLEPALEELQKALAFQPDCELPYFELARVYLKLNQPEETERHFQLGLEKVSSDLEHHYYRIGNEYRKSEAYPECIPYFQKALALNPKDDCSYYGLCCAYRRLKDYTKALHYGKRAIACAPWGWYNHYMLGLCFADLHIGKKAIPHLEKAFQLANEDQKATIGYLTCSWLLFFKDETKLESHLQQFLTLEVSAEANHYAGQLINLAQYVLELRQQNISERCLARVLELAADQDSLHEAGKLFQKLQLIDQAEACFVKALSLNPESIEANRQLANFYYTTHQLERAVEQYLQMLVLDTDNTEPYAKLAEIHRKPGHPAMANRFLRKRLKQFPGNLGLSSSKLQPIDEHQNQNTRHYILHLLELNQQLLRGKQ